MPPEPSYQVLVSQDGIYEITYAELQSAGLPVDTLDPRNLQVFERGAEIALVVSGQADGTFDPGDTIRFYGMKNVSRYTDTNVYWLTWGSAQGKRMLSIDGTPDTPLATPESFKKTVRLEKNEYYVTNVVTSPEKDHWYYDQLIWTVGAPASTTVTTTITHIDPAMQDITIRGLLKGLLAEPEHHTRVYFNNYLIDDATWEKQKDYYFTATVPASLLIEGQNDFAVEVLADNGISYNFVLINWFEIDYQSLYETGENRFYFSGDAAGFWEYQVSGFSQDDISVWDITDVAESGPGDQSPTTVAKRLLLA